MNLREQIEKEITEKVMVKLASEKVELGLIDDLESQTKESKSILNDIENFGKQAEKKVEEINAIKKQLKSEISATKKIQKSLDSKFNAYDKYNSRADKLYRKVLKSAKDLGINENKLEGVSEWLAGDKQYKKMAFKYRSLSDKDLEK